MSLVNVKQKRIVRNDLFLYGIFYSICVTSAIYNVLNYS
jgi:hypothetical protein